MSAAADTPTWMRAGTLARHLGVDRKTVRRWIQKRQIVAMRLPSGEYRIPREVFGPLLHGAQRARRPLPDSSLQLAFDETSAAAW